MVDIVAGGFDFGVRSADRVPVDMIALQLGLARRNVVVASPTYLEARGTPTIPQDLMKHACLRVRLPNGAIHRWAFEKDGQSVHIDVGALSRLMKPASPAPRSSLHSASLWQWNPTCRKTSRPAGW